VPSHLVSAVSWEMASGRTEVRAAAVTGARFVDLLGFPVLVITPARRSGRAICVDA
jgi:hypothetical protein